MWVPPPHAAPPHLNHFRTPLLYGVFKKWAPSHTTADSSRTYQGDLAAPAPKLAQQTSEATGIDFFEWAAPPGATFREGRKGGEGKKRKERGKKKNDVAGATEIDLFLFPRLGRRRERLRARLIISRPGRGRGDEEKRDEALGTIGAMGIDFSSWLRAETIKCAVDFSGDN